MTKPANKPEIPKSGAPAKAPDSTTPPSKQEIGGRGGLDPVRYGDWEVGGKCVDF